MSKRQCLIKLTTLGEEKGFLTYDHVNDLLHSEVISSDQIDDIIMLFGKKNIDIIYTDKGKKLVVKKAAGGLDSGHSRRAWAGISVHHTRIEHPAG
jgi:hypothetical protein